MSNSRVLRQRILFAVGAALLLAGIMMWALTGPSSVGWFAYAPLAEESWPSTMILQPGHAGGLALAFVGSIMLSGLVGYRLGLRRGY